MGIELALGVVSLVVGVVSGVQQANLANQAADAQKAANATSAAQTQVNSQEELRQRVREERIRRAQIIQASTNQGTTGSSGEGGALSSLDTNFGTLVSQSEGQSNTNSIINAYNQRATDLTNQSNILKSLTGTVQTGIDTFGTIFNNSTKNKNIF